MDNVTTPAVRRARPIYRVFVSSTWVDLQPERRALMDALNRMEEMRFVGMEFFGNRPDDTHDASIDQVDLCEVFVGIIGFRYGSGITEAEYRRARALGLPCFVYFKREDLSRPGLRDEDATRAPKLATFKEDLLRGHTVKEFSSPEELAANATADLHNWVAARWISLERTAAVAGPAPVLPPDADRTNILRLLERIQHDWIEGVLEASLHHRAWLDLGLDWKDSAVEHPWDRIVVAPNRPIQTLSREDSIAGVFESAQNTLLVLGEPGAGKTTTLLELTRDLIRRARASAVEPAPVVLTLSTWTGTQHKFSEWLVVELGLRYQVPKKIAQAWLDDARLVLLLDGLDEVPADRRVACVGAINAFAEAHHPPGLAVTCRVAEYDTLAVKLRLRAAICLQPLTPQQIERYFAAAGTGLDHLRRAMRDDEGLRELARTPLMLSVMTMAWGHASAGVRGPITGTIEERRQQLFAAYVQTALNRRGKSAGGYSTEQTVDWLSWLARRMKEHGHTLFAVEQLQPDWLGSAGRQFGYFMATRLLGMFGLLVPFLLWNHPLKLKVALGFLAGGLGLAMGGIDFGFARAKPGKGNRASQRFWSLLATTGAIAVLYSLILIRAFSEEPPAGAGFGMIYLLMAAFAFCMPLDVRALDVKPTASMRWSWRVALNRGLAGLAGMVLVISTVFLITFAFMMTSTGWDASSWKLSEVWPFFLGLIAGAGLAAVGWARIRPSKTALNILIAVSVPIFAGEVGMALVNPAEIVSWAFLLIQATPAVVIGVFGGFASTVIDPTRGRHAGAWFWLRVPVLMFVFVGLVMLIPGFVWIYTSWGTPAEAARGTQWGPVIAFAAGCGLVAFLRFGGFNGVQHFFLRGLLVRSGELPPKAETFFNHAARLAPAAEGGLRLPLHPCAAARPSRGARARSGQENGGVRKLTCLSRSKTATVSPPRFFRHNRCRCADRF
ncbi:MAG: DUF4062 domain-containing protein [Lacunisphaera sp.]